MPKEKAASSSKLPPPEPAVYPQPFNYAVTGFMQCDHFDDTRNRNEGAPAMTLSIAPAALALILGAAVLHAIWNALVKGSVDRALTMALISFGHGILGAVLVLIYPVRRPKAGLSSHFRPSSTSSTTRS